ILSMGDQFSGFLCSPEKQEKNRARSLSLLHLPPKDGSETGADQGSGMDLIFEYLGQRASPPRWLVVLIFPVFRPPIPRKFSHCNKPLLLFVCLTGEGASVELRHGHAFSAEAERRAGRIAGSLLFTLAATSSRARRIASRAVKARNFSIPGIALCIF